MPREISGMRIARSFISPTNSEASRTIDFQLGARQGIAIQGVLGSIIGDPAGYSPSTSVITEMNATHTLHLESGALETVPDQAAEDEDTIDSEIFYRQDLWMAGNDDSATEFRASVNALVVPSSPVWYPRPLYSARNITHRGITRDADLDVLAHVIIYYIFVEFSLAELGLILARRT